MSIIKKILAAVLSLSMILVLLGGCALPGPKLSRGVWENDVYKNDFSKLQFALPEGWTVSADEEIAAMTGQAAEIFTDKEKWLVEAAKLTTIYDTMAKDPISGNNVLILYENLAKVTGGLKMTEQDYLDATEEQLLGLDAMKYTFQEPREMKLGDITYLTVRADEENYELAQYFLIHKQGSYIVGVTVTIFDGTEIGDILSHFK